MLCLYTAKGGVGCSVVAAALAVLTARQRPVLLVDLGGDLSSILGVPPERLGIYDWLLAESAPADALPRLEAEVGDGLWLLPAGIRSSDEPLDPQTIELLARLLSTERRDVIVDIGTLALAPLMAAAERTILVTRSCYLALRRAQNSSTPDAIILVTEPGRALRAGDVAAAIGAPISATVAWDPAVARAVDAGLLCSRVPRSLTTLRALVAPHRASA